MYVFLYLSAQYQHLSCPKTIIYFSIVGKWFLVLWIFFGIISSIILYMDVLLHIVLVTWLWNLHKLYAQQNATRFKIWILSVLMVFIFGIWITDIYLYNAFCIRFQDDLSDSSIATFANLQMEILHLNRNADGKPCFP